VQLDGAGDVTFLVEVGVLVDLGNHDSTVRQMLGDPVARDEHILCVAHRFLHHYRI
jgi:hypothetical protein